MNCPPQAGEGHLHQAGCLTAYGARCGSWLLTGGAGRSGLRWSSSDGGLVAGSSGENSASPAAKWVDGGDAAGCFWPPGGVQSHQGFPRRSRQCFIDDEVGHPSSSELLCGKPLVQQVARAAAPMLGSPEAGWPRTPTPGWLLEDARSQDSPRGQRSRRGHQ